MAEQVETQEFDDHDIFLIEIKRGDNPRYVLAERFLVIGPGQEAIGVPWRELEMLFRSPLRAVPLPGRRHDGRRTHSGVGTGPGVGTDPGVGTNVEINVFNARTNG